MYTHQLHVGCDTGVLTQVRSALLQRHYSAVEYSWQAAQLISTAATGVSNFFKPLRRFSIYIAEVKQSASYWKCCCCNAIRNTVTVLDSTSITATYGCQFDSADCMHNVLLYLLVMYTLLHCTRTQDMYGDGVLNHLSAMAAESDELSAGLNKTLFTPIWDR
jgi:hypothetical protein